MTKTKIKKDAKINDIDLKSLLKVPISKSVFTKKVIPKRFLAIYSFVIVILIIVISLLINNIGNYPLVSNSYLAMANFLGILIIIGGVYGTFYIYLNALEGRRRPFWESLFVSTSIALPFVFLGNLFNYFGQLTSSLGFATFMMYLMFAAVIYLFVAFILNFKNYYETTIYRVLVSLVLTFMTLIVFVVMPTYINLIVG